MIRLLIFIALGYFALKAVKGIFRHGAHLRVDPGGRQEAEIEDLMVQDPNCQTYIPKREAIMVKHNGARLYFCSARCRDAYLISVK